MDTVNMIFDLTDLPLILTASPLTSLTSPLTWACVALVACVCDLCSQVQVVLPLLWSAIVGTDADHSPGEAGQVTHLVIQDPTSPLCHVSEATRWLLYQVGFNCLQQHTRLVLNSVFESLAQIAAGSCAVSKSCLLICPGFHVARHMKNGNDSIWSPTSKALKDSFVFHSSVLAICCVRLRCICV